MEKSSVFSLQFIIKLRHLNAILHIKLQLSKACVFIICLSSKHLGFSWYLWSVKCSLYSTTYITHNISG